MLPLLVTTGLLGFLAYDRQDLGGAEDSLQQALAYFRDVGNPWGVALSQLGLAGVAAERDAFSQAIQLGSQALALYKDVDYQWGISMAQYTQARILLRAGNAVGQESGKGRGAASTDADSRRILLRMDDGVRALESGTSGVPHTGVRPCPPRRSRSARPWRTT